MMTAVLSMYDAYDFFTAPNTSDFDAVSKGYEKDFKALMTQRRNAWLAGESADAQTALAQLN